MRFPWDCGAVQTFAMNTKTGTTTARTRPLVASAQSGRRPRNRATLAIASGSVLLGTIGVFIHFANASPLTATWFRCAFGLLGLSLWFGWHRQMGAVRLAARVAPWVVVAATLMVAAWVLFFGAISRTSAGMAIVLFHFQPMWVLILARVCLKEPVARRRIAAVTVAMFGLVLATGLLNHTVLPGESETARTSYWIGVVFCLIGAFCTACVTIIVGKLPGLRPGVLAWWQCAIGTAVLWIWPMSEGWPPFGTAWLWLAGLGLIHTGLAYTLLYAGIAKLSSGRVAVLQFIYPAVALLIDWTVFDQTLSHYQIAGVVVMGASIWFAERGPQT